MSPPAIVLLEISLVPALSKIRFLRSRARDRGFHLCDLLGKCSYWKGRIGGGQGEGKEPGKDVETLAGQFPGGRLETQPKAKLGPLEAKGLQWYPQTSQFLHGGRPCGNRRPQPDVLDSSNLAEGNSQRKERLRAVSLQHCLWITALGCKAGGAPKVTIAFLLWKGQSSYEFQRLFPMNNQMKETRILERQQRGVCLEA